MSRTSTPLAQVATVAIGLLLGLPVFARPLDVEDRYRLQQLSDPQISPDGAWVAYCVSSSRKDSDADEDDIWLTSWSGRQTLHLTNTPSGEHSPRWSPDGHLLAFLTDRGDEKAGDQIWVLDRRGGEARQLSHFDEGITSFAWSPDGLRLVFSAEVRPADQKNADGAKPKPIVIDRLQFKSDNGGYLRGERTHLFLFDVQSGEVTPLTSGAFNELQPSWSPDGSQVVFISKRGDNPDANNNWDVYVVDARPDSTPRKLTTSLGTDGDPDEEWGTRPPSFSPDGKHISYVAYGAPEDTWYSLLQVSVVGLQQDDARLPMSALDRNTLDPRWSSDGLWIYFRLEDDLSVVLARVRVKDGRVERLTEPGAVVSEFNTGRAGRAGRIAVVQSTLSKPSELFAVEGRKLRQLTHHNEAWLQDMQLSEGRTLQFKSADGSTIRGLMLAPTGGAVGRKPTVLRIHGGPIAQHQNEFDFDWQLLAANGYVVVAPNPRGSSGRGYQFQKMLFSDWGHADVPDILAAADYVVSVGIADPQRLGIGGWSYGALLTNYVISSDTRFKAATVGAGMGNMLAGYGDDMYVREWEIELGLPWEKTDHWMNLSSPFLHADRIRTPTLFLVGSEDYNVPQIGSEQMYQALRRLGVPTQLIIYPGAHHWLARPSYRADRVRRYLEWYGRYLKAGESKTD